MEFVQNRAARNAVMNGANSEAKSRPLSDFLPPGTNASALDLLTKMLMFKPENRISVEGCLEHPYLKELHAQMSEPVADTNFDGDFEKRGYAPGQTIPKEDLQDLMFQEMLQLRPLGEESMESMEFSVENLHVGEGDECKQEAESKISEEKDYEMKG